MSGGRETWKWGLGEALLMQPPTTRLRQLAAAALVILVVANVGAAIFETVDHLRAGWYAQLLMLERISAVVFIIEYLLRLWLAPHMLAGASAHSPRKSRLRFALSPTMLVDAGVIIALAAPFVPFDLRVLRVLRLLRMLRIAKAARYGRGIALLGKVIAARRAELASVGAIAAAVLLIAATLLHSVEGARQPEQFGSIPSALWWAVATMTTVGYGDVVPVTAIGRVLASFVAVLGVALFALPTGIIGAGLMDELNHDPGKPDFAADERCPACGQPSERRVATTLPPRPADDRDISTEPHSTLT